MKLAAFPKTFGLTELQKGYFPHLFNRAENQDYVGPLPDSKFYDPDGMSTDDREKFYTWYNDLVERQHEFDFQAEILRYCRSDVDILRRCCFEFRELFSQITDVDPFASCLTIASAYNLVFRKTFLQENTIAVIPPCGYKPENKQSVIALKMLAWVANAIILPFATPATTESSALASTLSMASALRRTLFGKFKGACGMDAKDVTPEIP